MRQRTERNERNKIERIYTISEIIIHGVQVENLAQWPNYVPQQNDRCEQEVKKREHERKKKSITNHVCYQNLSNLHESSVMMMIRILHVCGVLRHCTNRRHAFRTESTEQNGWNVFRVYWPFRQHKNSMCKTIDSPQSTTTTMVAAREQNHFEISKEDS